MKKFLFSTALLVAATINAQTFGLKAGVNVANVSNLYETGTSSKAGFNAGAFVNIPVIDEFHIQPEILYNQKGLKYATGKEDYGYLSIPIMFQYNIVERFYLEAGPEFSVLLSAKDKFNGKETAQYEYEAGTYDVKDEYRTLDIGIGAGLGFDITKNIGINARYVAGLTDLYKDSTEGYIAKNSIFQISAYFKFGK